MIATLSSPEVCIRRIGPRYPSVPPFHPHERFPEVPSELGPQNEVYAAVREIFRRMGLDKENVSTLHWNPLSDLVHPGERIVIKPNLIGHAHRTRPSEWMSLVTHGSVIRPILDYALLALRGKGEIWIVDGPQFDADWAKVIERTGISEVCDYARKRSGGVSIRLLDLRSEWWPDTRDDVICRRERLAGDENGSQQIDLGSMSALSGHPGGGRYYGSDYDQAETNRHHSGGRHEYLVSRTCTSADLFINVAKMKTHKKVGVTLCLKNLVGINTGRNWLPHFTDGCPAEGGDGYPDPSGLRRWETRALRSLERMMMARPEAMAPWFRIAKRWGKRALGDSATVTRQGNWAGNDTCWRMVHDINTCLFYSDGTSFPIHPAKRYIGFIDGVIAGEGDGPAAPDPVRAGLIVAGFNPVAIDSAGAWLMGFDPLRLPMIRNAFAPRELPLAPFPYEAINLHSDSPEWNGVLASLGPGGPFRFKAHHGWTGAIEVADPERVGGDRQRRVR